MKKNPQPFLQPENTFFIKWESNFLSECTKRDVRIDSSFLEECKKQNLLKPVFEGKQETFEYADEKIIRKSIYYDIFQIPIIAEIYKRINKFSDIKDKAVEIKDAIKSYEKILPLLYDTRYFYQDELYSSFSSGIAPPFKLSEEELKKFNLDLVGLFEELKGKFKAEKYLKKYKISEKELRELRDKFYIEGHRNDPMNKWYPFLRTIRRTDGDKFKNIEGSVLLAHDYYIFAELLTHLYKDAFGDKIINPEDIFDLTGGKWKKRNCLKCKKEIKITNFHEKYCIDCKREIAQTTEASFKCECGAILFRFVESDEVVNKVYSAHKKSAETNLDLITDVKLDYGKMKIMAQCGKCGKLNMITREMGWY